jgi:predicted DNA-binding WGR domain protein
MVYFFHHPRYTFSIGDTQMTKILTFVNASTNTFWTLRFNEDSKRVATIGGRIGSRGYTRRLHFSTREEVRDYVETRVDVKVAKGYAQVA